MDKNGEPIFKGAVPLGPGGSAAASLVSCIWHKFGDDVAAHPPDAPQCWDQDGHRVMQLAGLLAWQTVNLTQLLSITNGIAQQLAETMVHLEALEATLE